MGGEKRTRRKNIKEREGSQEQGRSKEGRSTNNTQNQNWNADTNKRSDKHMETLACFWVHLWPCLHLFDSRNGNIYHLLRSTLRSKMTCQRVLLGSSCTPCGAGDGRLWRARAQCTCD